MNKFKKTTFIVFALLILFCAQNVHASSLNLVLDKTQIITGGLSNLSVILDTKGQLINTIEGDLVYDTNILKIEQVNIGSSFISFWVDKPVVENTGRVHFSGVVPGGVSLTTGEVFSVIFRGVSSGNNNFKLENVNLFINDGEGSKDEVKLQNVSLSILQNTNGVIEEIQNNDKIKPEKFKVFRTKDVSIFDNQYFLAFGTQDKGVGVAYYEVCEYLVKNCEQSESPYLLKYQNPFYYIVVSAYDINGNVRKSTLISNWLILSIVLLIILIFYTKSLSFRRYLRKFKV